MIDLTTPIIPYVGTGIFKLDSNYEEVKKILKKEKIPYSEEIINPNVNDIQWNILKICKDGETDSVIELFFAKGRLFKICLCEDFKGTLPNGIYTEMNIKDAKKIDPKLKQNEDWDEVYESPEGYWLEYSNHDLAIIFITIFIPALERDDFFDYNW